MFFLIPIGHDELTLRSLPFATIGLMVVCIVAFCLTFGAMTEDGARAQVQTETVSRPETDGFSLDETGEVIEGKPVPKSEATSAREPSRTDTIARRFGYVPDSPGVGIVTHIFLHAGVVQLVLTLLFLWTAGVRLEELWSRPVFLGAFALFGVLSALIYGVTSSDPATPLVGATGAVAGLMGALLVRLGRSKVHFAYFIWFGIGKPRVGTFEAPAYIIPPLWLLTQLGVQVGALMFTMSVWSGAAPYTQWIAGFAFGCAAAFALKKLRFEERVLGRKPETKVDPEDMPLVAFQRQAEPQRPAKAQDERLTVIAATLVGLDRKALRFELPVGGALDVDTADVRAWTAGRLSRVEAGDAALLGGSAPPQAPAVVLAFVIVKRSTDALPRAIVVDAALLKYSRLLEGPAGSPREAFFRLVTQLNVALPGSAFAGDRGRVHEGTLPEFAALKDFLQRLEAAIAVLKPRSPM